MFTKHIPLVVSMTLTVAVVIGPAGAVSAAPIYPGFDHFATAQGAYVDLSSFGLPSNVPLQGVPFGPGTTTDTLVHRPTGIDPFPQGNSGVIPIELVALHLKSTAPIDLTPIGFLGVFADLHTTVNKGGIVPSVPQPDALALSTGQMQVNHGAYPGGSFASCFGDMTDPFPECTVLGIPGGGVYADAIFTIPGGDPSNPSDVLISQPAPRVSMAASASGSFWLHTSPDPENDPHTPWFPAGDFYIEAILHTGPHPVIPGTGPTPPEPATFGLLAFAALALAGRRRRAR